MAPGAFIDICSIDDDSYTEIVNWGMMDMF